MELAALIQKHAWVATHPQVHIYAEQFTETQWDEITASGLPELLAQHPDDSIYIIPFFMQNAQVCLAVLYEEKIQELRQMLPKNLNDSAEWLPFVTHHCPQLLSLPYLNITRVLRKHYFGYYAEEEYVKYVQRRIQNFSKTFEKEDSRIIFKKQSALCEQLLSIEIRNKEVEKWLGPTLWNRLAESYPYLKESFLQVLSCPAVRTESLVFSCNLVRGRQKKFAEFLQEAQEIETQTIVPDLFKSMPLRQLAQQFSSEQQMILTETIHCDARYILGLLRFILFKTNIEDQQRIQECSQPELFRSLIVTLQASFLKMLGQAPEQAITYDKYTFLIRNYLSMYANVHVPIPPEEGPQLLNKTLRNAAKNAVEPWAVLILAEVADINEPNAAEGKTALHYAAMRPHNSRSSFNVLKYRPESKLAMRDKNGKTASDYAICDRTEILAPYCTYDEAFSKEFIDRDIPEMPVTLESIPLGVISNFK